jgi:hypothetical protein
VWHKSIMTRKRIAIWSVVAVLIAVVSTTLLITHFRTRTVTLTGVVLIADPDPRKQLPIPNVEITAMDGASVITQKSDSAGFFRLKLPMGAWLNETISIKFQHPDYRPLDVTQGLHDQICVVRLAAVPQKNADVQNPVEVTVTDARVRYAVKATTPINVGSIAKTFDVTNVGGLPCDRRSPCSPDGKWNATIGGITLDAGDGHEFQNVRVSCIAGPCPFTKIESDEFSRGGRIIKVSVRDWSDTVTFLVEADVIRSMMSDQIRQAYPAIFGRAMSFTLPPTGQGPSIEAEMNGTEIVYPLGPDLTLSWAVCNLQAGVDRAKLYSCELKPGYRFK